MKNLEHWACTKLIEHFCLNPNNWAREIKIAKKLLYDTPDLDSWLSVKLPKTIYSLAFFLTEQGKHFIPESRANPYVFDLDKLTTKKVNID